MSVQECLARFAWASRHVDRLQADLAPLQRAYREEPVTEEVHDGGKLIEYSLRGDLPRVPMEVGLRVSDCVHHLRAVLDNLAYTILVENHPDLPADERRRVTFPICIDTADWSENVTKKDVLSRLPAEAQTAIEGLQPYHSERDPKRHALAILKVLSDMDKHRTIPIVTWRMHPLSAPRVWSGPPPDERGVADLSGWDQKTSLFRDVRGTRWIFLANEVVPGTKFLRLELPRSRPKGQMHIMFSFGFGLRDPGYLRGSQVTRVLNRIRHEVRNVCLPTLVAYCPATSEDVGIAALRYENFSRFGDFRAPKGSMARIGAEAD
jgi:hypothetical protein